MLRISGGISDEGFSGSRVRDTEDKNRFSKEGADFLKDALAKAIQPTKNLSATNKEKISQVSSKMTQALADNTEAVQKIMSEQDDTRKEFLKLISMMTDAQKKTGESSQVAMKEIIKQIERVKLTDGEGTKDVAKILGLDAAQKEIAKPLGRQTMTGALVEKLTNVDIRKESITKAFTLEKMFGLKPGSDDILKSAQDEVAAGKTNSERAGAQEDLAAATLGDTSTVSEKVEKVKQSKEKEINTTTVPVVTMNSEGGQSFATGTDRISPAFQQVDLLEQILEQLKKMESLSDNSMGLIPGLPDVDVDGPNGKNKTKKPGRLGRAAKTVAKAAAAAATLLSPTVLGGIAATATLVATPLIVAQLVKENWPGENRRPDGPERTRRTAGGRETTTTAPLSSIERRNMEEYGTIDREEIQKIQMERAGYATPEVIDSKPLTDLSQEETVKAQTENPALIQAVKDMPAAQREAFLEVNPHMIPLVNDTGSLATPEIAPPSKGESVSQLADIGTMPLVGAGVLSMEAQGLEKVVSPTGDAVNNMSSLYNEKVANVINNINNITNNNNTSGGGAQAPNVLVNPPTARNMGSSWGEFLNKLATGR
jgi:hypothetical protein